MLYGLKASNRRWVTDTLWVDSEVGVFKDSTGKTVKVVASDREAYRELRNRGLSPQEARQRIGVSNGTVDGDIHQYV